MVKHTNGDTRRYSNNVQKSWPVGYLSSQAASMNLMVWHGFPVCYLDNTGRFLEFYEKKNLKRALKNISKSLRGDYGGSFSLGYMFAARASCGIFHDQDLFCAQLGLWAYLTIGCTTLLDTLNATPGFNVGADTVIAFVNYLVDNTRNPSTSRSNPMEISPCAFLFAGRLILQACLCLRHESFMAIPPSLVGNLVLGGYLHNATPSNRGIDTNRNSIGTFSLADKVTYSGFFNEPAAALFNGRPFGQTPFDAARGFVPGEDIIDFRWFGQDLFQYANSVGVFGDSKTHSVIVSYCSQDADLQQQAKPPVPARVYPQGPENNAAAQQPPAPQGATQSGWN